MKVDRVTWAKVPCARACGFQVEWYRKENEKLWDKINYLRDEIDWKEKVIDSFEGCAEFGMRGVRTCTFMQLTEIKRNEELVLDVLPKVNHELKQVKAQLKFQEKELANHRRLDWTCLDKTPDQTKMEGQDVDDKSEFTFKPKSQDTVTDRSMSQVSLLSKRSQPIKEKKPRDCPDCLRSFRDPSSLRRHRGGDDDICAQIRKNQKK